MRTSFTSRSASSARGPSVRITARRCTTANDDGIKETFVGSTLDGQPNHGFQVDDNGNPKQAPTSSEGPLLAAPDPWCGPCRCARLLQPRARERNRRRLVPATQRRLLDGGGSASAQCVQRDLRCRRWRSARSVSPSPGRDRSPRQASTPWWRASPRAAPAGVWTAPETRYHRAGCTNPFWVAINTYLSAIGLSTAEFDTQEAYFDSLPLRWPPRRSRTRR